MQSIQFLEAVRAFHAAFMTSTAVNDSAKEYKAFVEIAETYIRDNSPFEVNIDSKTKHGIMGMAREATFKELQLVGTTDSGVG